MTYSNDMICIECHHRWPDIWNAYLIFTKPKLIWCNVDIDNLLILSGLWKKLIVKVHWRTSVSMVQFKIAASYLGLMWYCQPFKVHSSVSLCYIKDMYKSIQMKLQFKEHIFLTKYVSGKDVMTMFWFDFNGTICSHILEVLFDYWTTSTNWF